MNRPAISRRALFATDKVIKMRLTSSIATWSLMALGTIAGTEPVVWAKEGDWEIMSRAEDPPGCFARRTFENGTEIQIGTEPSRSGWYFAAFNPDWTHLNEEKVTAVEFEFPDVIFAGSAEFRQQAEVPGGYVFFNNPEFLDEFGNRMSFRVSGPNGTGIEIDLSGSKRAVAAMENCQSSQP